MGIAAYKRTITETESPRQIERRVFLGVTAQMEAFQQDFDNADGPAAKLYILSNGLRQALWQNEQVWLTVRTDLLEPENALSQELRAGLISLAIWVERHTQLALQGSEDIGPLIDINRGIILGLEGTHGETKGAA